MRTRLLILSLLPLATQAQSLFTDVAKTAGLDFNHFNGMSGEYYFPEMTGQGGALIDYDNDGDLDLYLVQGSVLGPGKKMKDMRFPGDEAVPRDRLYRNDLTHNRKGEPLLRFTDVTEESGITGIEYGMGAAVGDVDNDGWTDIYVTNYGPNRLWRNNGDGSFSDITSQAGVGDAQWGTSAAFFDYDGDGRLDLYVANYVAFDLEKNPACYGASSRRDYCGPSGFTPQRDRLYHNLGKGRFEEVSAKVLPGYRPGPGLGVISADFDGNGLIDLYVANDGKVNQLWLNQGDGTFLEDALFAGAAVNREGRPEASMGVDAADFDGDGDIDLFMTHLMGESNTLYVNQGKGIFEDRSNALGIAAASLPYTAFGTAWLDFDNDGWLDLLVLNGAVATLEALAAKGDPYPLGQPNQLFRNQQGKRFVEVSQQAGKNFALAEVSRGAAFGDLDNDGDTDAVVFNNNGPVRLLRNNVGSDEPWLGLRLRDETLKRDAYGARVELVREKGPSIWRRVRVDGSYCAANDPRVLIGLGGMGKLKALRIHWPGGDVETRPVPAAGAYHTLARGAGE